MQQPDNTPSSLATGADYAARSVLGILTDHYPALLSFDEVVHEYAGFSLDLSQARVMVADALAHLMQAGLVHRLDQFVFASRPAVRAEQLRL